MPSGTLRSVLLHAGREHSGRDEIGDNGRDGSATNGHRRDSDNPIGLRPRPAHRGHLTSAREAGQRTQAQ